MDLLGVRAHDVRAFAASKAFYGGVSMDQILQACHWKSQYIHFILPKGPLGSEPEGPLLPFRILRGCTTSDASLLADHGHLQKKGGSHPTTHPADGAGQNPDRVERDFSSQKVNYIVFS